MISWPRIRSLGYLLTGRPAAQAVVTGNPEYPNIYGVVSFYPAKGAIVVAASIDGLPSDPGDCGGRFFGFHIHMGSACAGNAEDPFADAEGHYNPADCPHPEHAGDLPPLLGNRGYALSTVLTSRFTLDQVMGRTVIIHLDPDDFHSQPSGNSGQKIACGVIRRP